MQIQWENYSSKSHKLFASGNIDSMFYMYEYMLVISLITNMMDLPNRNLIRILNSSDSKVKKLRKPFGFYRIGKLCLPVHTELYTFEPERNYRK